jgi:hypothetical protein
MPRLYKRRKVDILPAEAIKVSDYARQQGCHHSLIYHQIARNKATYEIVNFQGINFVIPSTITQS